MPVIVVTGTDTNVGKTYFSVRLLRALSHRGFKVCGFKPVASGATLVDGVLKHDDVEALKSAANVEIEDTLINPYRFEPAIAPHIAARKSGIKIEVNHLNECLRMIQQQVDWVVLEGAGGWQLPFNESVSFADWVVQHDWKVVLVVGMRLGCINHARLTVFDISSRHVPLAGWVANCLEPDFDFIEENIQTIQSCTQSPLLCTLPYRASVFPSDIVKEPEIIAVESILDSTPTKSKP